MLSVELGVVSEGLSETKFWNHLERKIQRSNKCAGKIIIFENLTIFRNWSSVCGSLGLTGVPTQTVSTTNISVVNPQNTDAGDGAKSVIIMFFDRVAVVGPLADQQSTRQQPFRLVARHPPENLFLAGFQVPGLE